jgi:NADPH:quinone reductase-like Zn-dependent oxidoreductase
MRAENPRRNESSDLQGTWSGRSRRAARPGHPGADGVNPRAEGSIGHEFIGVVETVGDQVSDLAPGDLVIAPFTFRINPGLVFDFETDLDHIAEAYTAMDERRAIKSLIRTSAI